MEIVLIVIVGLLLFAGLALWGGYLEKKRQDALAAAAGRLGLGYFPERDRALGRQHEWINDFRQGKNRYAFDVIRGAHRGHEILVFSYHYETESTDSKGRQQTSHYYLHAYVVGLPVKVPEMTLVKEGLFSKIAQAFGYDDIDFESHEFSKTFCVRSKDKKFAYDVCHPRVMEFLLDNRDLKIELEENRLALVFPGKVERTELEGNLLRLVQFRDLMPAYLWAA